MKRGVHTPNQQHDRKEHDVKNRFFVTAAIAAILFGASYALPVQAGPASQQSDSFITPQGSVMAPTALTPDEDYDALNYDLGIEELTPNVGYSPHLGFRPMTTLPCTRPTACQSSASAGRPGRVTCWASTAKATGQPLDSMGAS